MSTPEPSPDSARLSESEAPVTVEPAKTSTFSTLARVVAVLLGSAAILLALFGLQAYETWRLPVIAGAAYPSPGIPGPALKAIDLYVDTGKTLLSYALAAVGALGYLVQKDLENKAAARSTLGVVLVVSAFLFLVASVFFGISALQYIADALSRNLAFATPSVAGFPVEERYRAVTRLQFYAFTIALSLAAAEVLRRLTARPVVAEPPPPPALTVKLVQEKSE